MYVSNPAQRQGGAGYGVRVGGEPASTFSGWLGSMECGHCAKPWPLGQRRGSAIPTSFLGSLHEVAYLQFDQL